MSFTGTSISGSILQALAKKYPEAKTGDFDL